jgi:hypothetical protein
MRGISPGFGFMAREMQRGIGMFVLTDICLAFRIFNYILLCTVNSTSDCTLWALYHSYFSGISANIELQVYSMMSC